MFGDLCAGSFLASPTAHLTPLKIQTIGQDESLFNNLHFIKGAHPHQTTGSKVTDF
jgi:hypothetical protein